MPTPVGHVLGGMAVGLFCTRRRPLLGPRADLALFAGLAVWPDLDFIPGLLAGQANLYHHAFTHTLLAVGLMALGMGLWGLWSRGRGEARRWALIGGLVALSHLALDYLALDTRPPIGLPLFWPFLDGWWAAPEPVFLDIRRGAPTLELILHDIMAVVRELALLGPFFLLALLFRRQAPAGLVSEAKVENIHRHTALQRD